MGRRGVYGLESPLRRRSAKRPHYRVVKGGNAPCALLFHENPNAEFSVRRQLLPVRIHQPTELVSHMSDHNIRLDKSDAYFQCL